MSFCSYLCLSLLCAAPPQLGPAAGHVLAIEAGETPVCDGLTLAWPDHAPGLETRGGRSCWRTDHTSGKDYLHVRCDPDFWREGGAPLRVTVTYWDEGTDGFAIKYQSLSEAVGADAPETPQHYKTDTLSWQEHTFQIADAWVSAEYPAVLWLTSNSWLDGGAEDSIAKVEVRMGGISIGPTTTWCSADPNQAAELTVTAVPGPGFDVRLDDDDIALKSDVGFIEATAHLTDGQALVYFVPPTEPGDETVTASFNGYESVSHITVVPGTGPLAEDAGCYVNFGYYPAEQVTGVETTAVGRLEALDDCPSEPGVPALAVDYRYDNPANGSARAVVPLWLELPGVPTALQLVYRGDDSRNRFWLIFGDSTGQGFYLPIGSVSNQFWQARNLAFTSINRHTGGEDDGRWHFPVTVRELRILNGRDHGGAASKVTHLGWLYIRCAASESAWAEWRAAHPELAGQPPAAPAPPRPTGRVIVKPR